MYGNFVLFRKTGFLSGSRCFPVSLYPENNREYAKRKDGATHGKRKFRKKKSLPAKKEEQPLEFQRKMAILVVFMSPIVIPLVAAA